MHSICCVSVLLRIMLHFCVFPCLCQQTSTAFSLVSGSSAILLHTLETNAPSVSTPGYTANHDRWFFCGHASVIGPKKDWGGFTQDTPIESQLFSIKSNWHPLESQCLLVMTWYCPIIYCIYIYTVYIYIFHMFPLYAQKINEILLASHYKSIKTPARSNELTTLAGEIHSNPMKMHSFHMISDEFHWNLVGGCC